MFYSVFDGVSLPLGGFIGIHHESEGGHEDQQLAPRGLQSDEKR